MGRPCRCHGCFLLLFELLIVCCCIRTGAALPDRLLIDVAGANATAAYETANIVIDTGNEGWFDGWKYRYKRSNADDGYIIFKSDVGFRALGVEAFHAFNTTWQLSILYGDTYPGQFSIAETISNTNVAAPDSWALQPGLVDGADERAALWRSYTLQLTDANCSKYLAVALSGKNRFTYPFASRLRWLCLQESDSSCVFVGMQDPRPIMNLTDGGCKLHRSI